MTLSELTVFKDLTIIELSSVLAGPAVGLFFAELGAKVIKIENKTTGGDVTRTWKHPSEDPLSSKSAYYHSVNWNKESVFVDLKNKAEKESVYELIKTADIVISNYRPTNAKKLGMDYASLKQINPTIIFGLITAYGEDDDRPGFDALLQAETGWMYMNGQAEGPPTKMPVALIDILAAHQLKEGLLVALLDKYKTGHGSKVSVSLFDAAVSALANQASNYLNLDIIPQRKGSQHPNIAPYGDIHRTKDGILILLSIGNDNQFSNLCRIVNLPGLTTDSRFTSNSQRVVNRDLLNKELQQAFILLNSTDLLTKAKTLSVPLGPIRNMVELFSDPLSQELILAEKENDGSTSKRVKTTVFKLSNNH